MRLALIAPSTAYPSGGVAAIYEFAATMARREELLERYLADPARYGVPQGHCHH